jgi:hypothetical protein
MVVGDHAGRNLAGGCRCEFEILAAGGRIIRHTADAKTVW